MSKKIKLIALAVVLIFALFPLVVSLAHAGDATEDSVKKPARKSGTVLARLSEMREDFSLTAA